MPIELTAGQWISVAGVVTFAIFGVNALRRDQRWFALLCGVIVAQCLAWLIPHGGGGSMRFFVNFPFWIAVLLISHRASEETKRARAAQTGAAPQPPP